MRFNDCHLDSVCKERAHPISRRFPANPVRLVSAPFAACAYVACRDKNAPELNSEKTLMRFRFEHADSSSNSEDLISGRVAKNPSILVSRLYEGAGQA